MSNRLVALEKCPGVIPVGIGDIWSRCATKCMIEACVDNAKLECGAEQLCSGIKAGIEGVIHTMRSVWRDQADEDEGWGGFSCG